jgi:hypothetical protein
MHHTLSPRGQSKTKREAPQKTQKNFIINTKTKIKEAQGHPKSSISASFEEVVMQGYTNWLSVWDSLALASAFQHLTTLGLTN